MYRTPALRLGTRRTLALAVLAALSLDGVPRAAIATTHFVTTCADGASLAGSLRATVGSATSGDTIDLSQLTCSVITLSNGEIVIGENDLVIRDSAVRVAAQRIAISGNNAGHVLRHLGSGTLTLNNIAVIDGKNVIQQGALGGCIYSNGNVSLDHATVHNCIAGATYLTGGNAYGGAIFARGAVSLTNGSSVVGGQAYGAVAKGGGIYATNGFTATDSEIVSNEAFGIQGGGTMGGGGVFVKGGPVRVKYSTISSNTSGVIGNGNAGYGGGIYTENPSSVTIANSTIYGNTASLGGGIESFRDITVTNSTIAHNRATTHDAGISVHFNRLTLNSSIVSNNTTGVVAASAVEDDVGLRYGGSWSSVGKDNLVMAANVAPPANVVRFTVDPQLGTLGSHGGAADTMLPQAGSPVLNAGNNLNGLSFEQRGGHYPRTSAGHTDIGAVQYDNLFGDGFE